MFTVSPKKQIYYCFGCGAGGSVFHFIMMRDLLCFSDAVRVLGKRCGVAVPGKAIDQSSTSPQDITETKPEELMALRDARRPGEIPNGYGISLFFGATSQDNGFWFEIRASRGVSGSSWQVVSGFVSNLKSLEETLWDS
ncbi:MAG: CHC2 zinc finger domain-containing protein, partial [Desulfovibrionales bacterium]|nr:CHC2 zinc finger domain-containing protein [Desulfovibrionales bacterium]